MKFGSYVSLKDSAPNILNYLKVFRSYLGFRMYYVFMLTILGGLMESIGIMMFLPLLQSINSVGKPMEDGMDGDNYTLLSNFPLDSFAIFSHENSVVFILLAIATAFILKAVVAFASLAYSAYLRGELLKMLKNRMYDSYGLMKYEYYITQDSGKFINIVNEQITRTLLSFQHLTLMITQIVTGFIYLFLGLLLSWKFGLMSILVGIIILNLFRWLNKYVRAISRDTAKENSILSGLLIQALHAFKYLKATGQYKCLKTGVTNSISNLTKFQVKTGISVGFTQAIREPVAVVLVMSIVIVQLVFF